MTVRVYRSTDGSAPVLSGAAGALATVLDAVLVNGYGSKTAAGWAIEFTGTNKRVYRAASGNRLRLRVDDTGTSNARVIGYESMSDVDTGTAGFPTDAQISGGLYWLKSTLTDSTARAWLIIATGTMFYMFVNTGGAGAGSAWSSNVNSFGDFTSYKASDTSGVRIIGNISTTVSSTNSHGLKCFTAATGSAISGAYVARANNLIGGSINVGQAVSSLITGVVASYGNAQTIGSNIDWANGALSNSAPTYPNAPDGALQMGRVFITESAVSLRGYLPGLWAPCIGAGTPPAFNDTWSGTGDLSGKTFELILLSAGSNVGRVAIETSDTW
jgi:hypothetical protein